LLALGAGVLYLTLSPKLAQQTRGGWRNLLERWRTGGKRQTPDTGASARVLGVFAMRQADGREQLIAAELGEGGIRLLSQIPLPAGVTLEDPGSRTLLQDALEQLSTNAFGAAGLPPDDALLLLDPRLQQLQGTIASDGRSSRALSFDLLREAVRSCSPSQINDLRLWLNQPSSTPPERNPLHELLLQRLTAYQDAMPEAQARIATMLELSLALAYSGDRG
jgi:hypothetical protein